MLLLKDIQYNRKYSGLQTDETVTNLHLTTILEALRMNTVILVRSQFFIP